MKMTLIILSKPAGGVTRPVKAVINEVIERSLSGIEATTRQRRTALVAALAPQSSQVSCK